MKRRTALLAGAAASGSVVCGWWLWRDEAGGPGRSTDQPDRSWSRDDDAGSINDRLRAAGFGSEVRLPHADHGYAIATPLHIPAGVTLRCDPRTPIRASGDMKYMVAFRGPRGALVGAALDSGDARVPTLVLISPSATNVTVERCQLRSGRTTSVGVKAHGRQVGTRISQCAITGAGTGVSLIGHGRGLEVSKMSISSWVQRGVYIQQRGRGAYVDVIIRDNTVKDLAAGGVSRYPIVVSGSNSHKTRKLVVQGNTVVGSNTSYRDPHRPGTADQIAVRHARTVEVEDNVSTGGGDVGITVAHCHDARVRGNKTSRNDTAGVFVGTRSGFSMGNVLVEGNVCENNGQNRQQGRRAHGRAGIRVSDGGGRVTIRKNSIVDTQEPATQVSGITLDSAPDVTLSDNTISGAGSTVMRIHQ